MREASMLGVVVLDLTREREDVRHAASDDTVRTPPELDYTLSKEKELIEMNCGEAAMILLMGNKNNGLDRIVLVLYPGISHRKLEMELPSFDLSFISKNDHTPNK
uniref:Uncharacterized protein n=1 Tax=Grammatophora oceanica TaxID=210454 RepID=A0A7S1UTN2_9STRA|mmetsp:Transcript_22355/g.33263  ORF Transcript_22355/g.33263 Transcript_22355/m.33263 type:complete len:105 (+) Transcript_22355:336-650(+)